MKNVLRFFLMIVFAIAPCFVFPSIQSAFAETYSPPQNSKSELAWLSGQKIDADWQAYKAKFAECDTHNTFGGKDVGKYGCFTDANGNHKFDPDETNDTNRLKYLFPIPHSQSAVLYQSKMSLDLDGGYQACVLKAGGTNQCATSMGYESGLRTQYEKDIKAFGSLKKIPDAKLKIYFEKLFVQSDTVPYVVLPSSDNGEFSGATKVKTGDLGVVIFDNQVVPVLVADRGPYFRIGEASLRVFESLNSSRCRQWTSEDKTYCSRTRNSSISDGVTTILFPGSAFQAGILNPDNIVKTVSKKALQLYGALKGK